LVTALTLLQLILMKLQEKRKLLTSTFKMVVHIQFNTIIPPLDSLKEVEISLLKLLLISVASKDLILKIKLMDQEESTAV
jgi:hypothetical protein